MTRIQLFYVTQRRILQAMVLVFAMLATPTLAAAEDIVLQIGFADQLALTESLFKSNEVYLKEQWPDARVETISVRTGRLANFLGDKRVRRKMIQKMKDLTLQAGDRIHTLIIHTHGNSDPKKDSTTLHLIGKITSEGVDQEFTELFAPIKENISSDARIILNSCKTLCGTEEEAARRAISMLNSLGAPDGSLYGAVTYQAESGWRFKPTGKKILFYAMSALGMTEVQLIANAVLFPEFVYEMSSSQYGLLLWMAKTGAAFGSLGYLIDAVLVPLSGASQIMKHKLNYGRLFRFHEGQLVLAEEKSYTLDQNEIMGPRCEDSLLPQSN